MKIPSGRVYNYTPPEEKRQMRPVTLTQRGWALLLTAPFIVGLLVPLAVIGDWR